MNCPRHPIRKRPKACATCAANVGTTVAQAINDDRPEGDYLRPVMWPEDEAPKPRSPRTTADGATWLDPDGKPPVENARGELVEPFVFQLANGACERWGVGLKLPDTPARYRAWVAEIEAKRARTIKPKERELIQLYECPTCGRDTAALTAVKSVADISGDHSRLMCPACAPISEGRPRYDFQPVMLGGIALRDCCGDAGDCGHECGVA